MNMYRFMTIGNKEENFKLHVSDENYNELIKMYDYSKEVQYFNNTKVTIEYQLNINHAVDGVLYEVSEYYNNVSDALTRMYNLKMVNVDWCAIFINIRDGKKNIIIDDLISVDIYDKCMSSQKELRELYIENESLKAENKLYKEFINKYNAVELFDKFKKEYK